MTQRPDKTLNTFHRTSVTPTIKEEGGLEIDLSDSKERDEPLGIRCTKLSNLHFIDDGTKTWYKPLGRGAQHKGRNGRNELCFTVEVIMKVHQPTVLKKITTTLPLNPTNVWNVFECIHLSSSSPRTRGRSPTRTERTGVLTREPENPGYSFFVFDR